MKFSFAFVFAAAAGVVASAELNLRAAISKLTGSATSQPTDADVRISIHGVVGDLKEEDVEIINESIEKSYNQVYSTVGFSMNSFETEFATSVPGSLGWDPYCRLCPPDVDTVTSVETGTTNTGQLLLGKVQVSWDPFCRLCPPDAAMKNLGDVHKTFENEFCAKLRGSGSDALAKVRECSFSFLDMPGQPEDNLPLQSSSSENTEAQLVLQGAINTDFSDKDLQIIDESIMSAYNEAFASAGFQLDSIHSVADFDLPNHVSWDPYCRLCPPVDAVAKVGSSSKLIVSSAAPLGWDPYCRLCPPADEDANLRTTSSSTFSDSQLAYMHTAFEKTLCIKLQKSGAVNLANVHSCSFRFVLAPISEITTA